MESVKQDNVILLLRDTRSYDMNAWILIFLLLLPTAFSAVRLQCGYKTHFMEVYENTTNFTLTCDGYDHLTTVLWQIKIERNTLTITLGNCNSSNCTLAQGIPPDKISITYLSSNSSRLTSSLTARNDDDFTYLCDTEQCQVNIMHPAVVDSCSLKVVSELWIGVIWCNISKAYSPSNNYSCDVFRNSSQADMVFASTTRYSPTNHSDAKYRIGSCNFTTDLPSSDGKYSYMAVVYPGGTVKYIDTVVIEQPSDPTIECTSQKCIFENTILNCTTTTRNIGKPPGRLQCFLEEKLLINAGYGEKCVNFNYYTLKRQDNLSNITCRINWIRNITGQNYTIMITSETTSLEEADAHSFHGDGLPAGVETAITLTVVLCSLGFITFIIWRHKFILPCSVNKAQNSHTRNLAQRPYDDMKLPEANAVTIALADTHSNTQPGTSPQSVYDALRIQEVGMTSAYDAVNYSRTSKDSSVKDRLDQEKVITDQPVYSNVQRKS